MSFNEFLKNEINKPRSEWFDPNGNSPKAIVGRGFLKEILWQYKKCPSRIKCEISCFNGLETPVVWFIQFPLLLFLAPICPLIWAAYTFDRAIEDYRVEYNRQKKDQQ